MFNGVICEMRVGGVLMFVRVDAIVHVGILAEWQLSRWRVGRPPLYTSIVYIDEETISEGFMTLDESEKVLYCMARPFT